NWSVAFPLPSSPHWAPTTTTLGISATSRKWIKPRKACWGLTTPQYRVPTPSGESAHRCTMLRTHSGQLHQRSGSLIKHRGPTMLVTRTSRRPIRLAENPSNEAGGRTVKKLINEVDDVIADALK